MNASRLAFRVLDLYCCEGGASRGYFLAGWAVYGSDLYQHKNTKGKSVGYSRKRYPFPAYRGDAIEVLNALLAGEVLPFTAPDGSVEWLGLADFDLIVASPPCQRYSVTNAARKHDYPDLIGPTRDLLIATGKPFVIENVVGAPLLDPVELCGCMFDLQAVDTDGITLHLQRIRLFESNLQLTAPREHDHSDHEWVGGSYGGARRDKYEARYVRKGGYVPSIPVQQALLGIDWMTQKGMFQSIPPAYTRHLGAQILDLLKDSSS